MQNLLNDPDVMALYKNLQNNKFEDIDDYLTSFIENDTHQGRSSNWETQERKLNPPRKIFWDGQEVEDFVGDNDYGLY